MDEKGLETLQQEALTQPVRVGVKNRDFSGTSRSEGTKTTDT